ncbi:MAG TPA: phosphatase PAP2 family protein [Pirellulales bacterium]|nr:phosphatase PAP2 family protein [Pirellulales bacterium]
MRRLAAPGFFTVLGFAALAIDLPLARWISTQPLPGFLEKTCGLAEVFGHGLGVAAILVTVWVLGPHLRSRLPRVICCAFLAGLIADGMKLLLSRSRPYKTDFASITSVWETFQHWFPFVSAGSGQQSFLSAHTATAVGLALGLSWLLPRGKWLFAFFALLVALQRIAGTDHFASDTLWGAALGWLVAAAFLPGGWLAARFDRLEHPLSAAW